MDKKFYWIKLRTDFFNREDIDFLLSQPNGCQYVVLYQMLCLNTANTDGRLQMQMNEMIVPFDVNKIARDTKYFDSDTIIVALELYKKLGLIYEEEDKILKISNYGEMVGSSFNNEHYKEQNRIRQQRYRDKQKLLESNVTITDDVTLNRNVENRDKRLENRDIDNNIKENIIKEKFTKPTLEEVRQYCLERNNNVDAEHFINFYESKGWMVGKNKMKDWKACVRTWEQSNKKNEPKEFTPEWFNEKPEYDTAEQEEEFNDILDSFK